MSDEADTFGQSELDDDSSQVSPNLGGVRSERVRSDRMSEQVEWDAARFRRGQIVSATVVDVRSDGIVVSVGDATGFVDSAELAWANYGRPAASFAVGDIVDAHVTGIDLQLSLAPHGRDTDDSKGWLIDLFGSQEGNTLEFRTSLMGRGAADQRRRQVDATLRTIAAFLNSYGGVFVYCVDDHREPVGIDTEVDDFGGEDAMLVFLSQLITERLGFGITANVSFTIERYRGARLLIIRCSPSTQPVWLHDELYVREGPWGRRLAPHQIVEYVRERAADALRDSSSQWVGQAVTRQGVGDLCNGTVTEVSPAGVKVDLGDIEGYVLSSELVWGAAVDARDLFSDGDSVSARVTEAGENAARVGLSIRLASPEPDWSAIDEAYTNRDAIDVEVVTRNKGGLVAEWAGIYALIPDEELEGDIADATTGEARANSYSQRRVHAKVLHVDQDQNRVILSERVVGLDERLAELEEGAIVPGTVTSTLPGRAFFDLDGLGGVSASLAAEEISWGGYVDPQAEFTVGQRIDKLGVKWVNRGAREVGLSIRDLDEIGWAVVTGETKTTEFKQVFRGAGGDDTQEEKALQEIVAFLNTDGGTVLFGVKNDGTLIGVDAVRRERFESEDNMLVHVDNLLHARLISQGSAVNLVRSRFVTHEGWRLFVVKVEVSDSPVWLRDGDPNSTEEHFYVRGEASVRKLTGLEEHAHIRAKFET